MLHFLSPVIVSINILTITMFFVAILRGIDLWFLLGGINDVLNHLVYSFIIVSYCYCFCFYYYCYDCYYWFHWFLLLSLIFIVAKYWIDAKMFFFVANPILISLLIETACWPVGWQNIMNHLRLIPMVGLCQIHYISLLAYWLIYYQHSHWLIPNEFHLFSAVFHCLRGLQCHKARKGSLGMEDAQSSPWIQHDSTRIGVLPSICGMVP